MITLPDLSGLPELHPEQLLSTEQLSAITGIPRNTFEKWRCRNPDPGPKSKKLGPQIVRYRWADYLSWRDQNDTTSAA